MDALRDIKPPLPLETFPHWPAWVWLTTGLVLLALAGLGAAAFRRWRRGTPTRRARRRLTRELDALTRDLDRLDDRDFADRFAALARRILAFRTGLAASAMTTDEIAARLVPSGLPQPLGTDLAGALSRTDPARYAPPSAAQAISPSRRRADLDLLRQVLRLERSC